MNESKEPILFNKTVLAIVGVIFISVFLIGIVLYFTKFHNGLSSSQETWGQFGDFYGGLLNPTLSFFALMGLIYTIKLQTEGLRNSQKQLSMSKEELKMSRQSINLATAELQNQNTKLTRQLFDSTFFNLLNFHHSIVNEMKIDISNITGRGCFQVWVDRLSDYYMNPILKEIYINSRVGNIILDEHEVKYLHTKYKSESIQYTSPEEQAQFKPFVNGDMPEFYSQLNQRRDEFKKNLLKNIIANTSESILKKNIDTMYSDLSISKKLEVHINSFHSLYSSAGDDFGHYFANIYNILDYIDSSALSNPDKIKYAKLFGRQLSKYEYVLLYYNCLSSICKQPFRTLVDKYRLRKKINRSDLIYPDDIDALWVHRSLSNP